MARSARIRVKNRVRVIYNAAKTCEMKTEVSKNAMLISLNP